MPDPISDIIRHNSTPLDPQPTGHPTALPKIEGIRAVLFDIYGTLFISGCGDVGVSAVGSEQDRSAIYQQMAAEAFSAVELPVPPAKAAIDQLLSEAIQNEHARMREAGTRYPEIDIVEIWGKTLANLSERHDWRPPRVDSELLRKLAAEYEVRSNPVWPMPEALETLTQLSKGGWTLGVVSNAQFYTPALFPALLDAEMDALGFAENLRFYSYKYRSGKPGEELYEAARAELQREGIGPRETLFVGNDLLNDVTAASGVGFRTALFAGDARSLRLREGDERVAGIVPDLVIDRLSQLLNCLSG